MSTQKRVANKVFLFEVAYKSRRVFRPTYFYTFILVQDKNTEVNNGVKINCVPTNTGSLGLRFHLQIVYGC